MLHCIASKNYKAGFNRVKYVYLKLTGIIYRNSSPDSQYTQYVAITKINLSVSCSHIIVVCCENHVKAHK